MARLFGLDRATQARTRELILAGNVGVPLIRRWIVTLDMPRERRWLPPATPAAGP